MSQDDDFMDIIQNSNLNDMTEADIHHMSVKDLHLGLKDLSQSMTIITEFIHDFFMSFEQEEAEHPSLTTDAIVYAKDMFAAAAKFCNEFYDNEFDDDDDDDYDEYDDDDYDEDSDEDEEE